MAMFNDSNLDIAKVLLGIGLVLANIAVWRGVYLEQDHFPKDTQDKGWRMLIRGLAAETMIALFSLTIDTIASNLQKEKIAGLYDRATIAERETARINNDTTVLNVRAKEAEAKIAIAQNEASQARAQTDRIKEKVAWRKISSNQFEILAKALSKSRGSVTIAHVQFDPEVGALTPQIADAFVAAIGISSGMERNTALHVTDMHNRSTNDSWQLVLEPRFFPNLVPLNIVIPGPENHTVLAIRSAFRAAGIRFLTGDIPSDDVFINGIHFNSKKLETDALIMIGSKPLEPDADPPPF
jgi:hypothetical protein